MVSLLVGYEKDLVLADNARVKRSALLQCCTVPAQEEDALGRTLRASNSGGYCPIAILVKHWTACDCPVRRVQSPQAVASCNEPVITCHL